MNLCLILVLQILAAHPRHRPADSPDVVVVDAAQAPVMLRGHEPTNLTARTDEVLTPLPRHRPAERAPWWLYGLVVALIIAGLSIPVTYYFASQNKRPSHESKIPLPDEETEPYGKVIHPPKTTQEYFAYVGTEEKEVRLIRTLPKDAPPRTIDECKAIYIEGVESLVQQIVWPAKLRCLRVEDAPIEIQWRAWLGDNWDREPIMRATGKEKGQALKSLLRKYKENGGSWISHAIERSVKTG